MSDTENDWPEVFYRPVTRRGFITVLAAAAGGAGVLAACGSEEKGAQTEVAETEVGLPSPEGPEARRLMIATPATPVTVEFEKVFAFEDTQAVLNLNEFLVTYGEPLQDPGGGNALVADSDPTHFRPWVAERWEQSPDMLTTTFYLRKGVTSSYGNEFTADDFVWGYDRVFWGVYKSFLADLFDLLPGCCQKIDDYTVQLTQRAPNVLLFPQLAANWSQLYDSTEAKKHATPDDPYATEWLQFKEGGFGPYRVAKLLAGQEMIFDKNPNYWTEPPYFDTLHFRQVDRSESRLALLLRGEVDVAEALAAKDLEEARKNPNVTVLDARATTLYVALYANWADPLLRDIRFRRALAYAIPYSDIIDELFHGRALVAKSALPPAVFGFTDQYADIAYDPQKARDLLAELGEIPSLELMYEPSRGESEQMAMILQDAFRDVGLTTELNGLPKASYGERVFKHEYQLVLDYMYPVLGDGVYDAWVMFSSKAATAYSSYNTPEVDALIKQAQNETDMDIRKQRLFAVQKKLWEDQAQINVLWPGTSLAVKKGITGYVVYPDNTTRYRELTRQA